MQSLHDLSHLEFMFQKAQSRISMVLFVALALPEDKTDCPKEGSWTGQ